MPELEITRIDDVGDRTVAVELQSPPEFEAYPGQFVLVRADLDGEEETGYYTISSPGVEDTFEMTVAVDPDGTLGPWLADRSVGDAIRVDGPFGDVQYVGDRDAVVLAGGPGIGPAVGIGERALEHGRDVTILYGGSSPAHRNRLDALSADGGTVVVDEDLDAGVDAVGFSTATVYVFGFEGFVEEARRVLSSAGVDPADAEIESFGPE